MKQQWCRFINDKIFLLVLCGLPLTWTGCASIPSPGSSTGLNQSTHEVGSPSVSSTPVVHSKDQALNVGEIVVQGVKLQNTQFDIPVTMNTAVEKWVEYFTGRGRGHFEKYLERSALFIPYIKPILRQNGIPEDLVYLAMIESGFANLARSAAKAVGPWQFISATGKRYGLAVNWWVDERRDTYKSTVSAAQYLKDLYEMFHSWELAAAAYNAGEAKIARAIRRYGTTDFWAISRQKFLRPETRNYVPKIIAAALISKNRTQFGFHPEPLRPGKDEAIAPDGTVVKLEKENAQSVTAATKEALESVLKAEDYENGATMDSLEDEEETDFASNSAPKVEEKEKEVPAVQAQSLSAPHVNKKGELMGEQLVEFEVQSPADLLKISRAAGLSYHTVKGLNPELLRWCTPPGATSYHVKLPSSVKEHFLSNYNAPGFERRVSFASVKVRSGQSLQSIARHFGLRTDPLTDLNRVSSKAALKSGTYVRLPMPNDPSRSMAALEIRDPPEKRRSRRRSATRRSARRDLQRVSFQARLKNQEASTYQQ